MSTIAQPVNSFDIYLNNLLQCDADGGDVIDPVLSTMIPLPANVVALGAPSNLQQLVNLVGVNNVNISYFAQANGTVSGYNCNNCAYYLNVKGNWDSTGSNSAIRDTTIYTTNSGGSQTISSPWVALPTNGTAVVMSKIRVSGEDNDSSACNVCTGTNDIWDNVQVSIKISVTVNLKNYCTIMGSNNIHSDACYYYMSDYMVANAGGDTAIQTYLFDYCNRNFHNDDLDIFNIPPTLNTPNMDTKNANICACNMPQSEYTAYENSLLGQYPGMNLGTVKPNCIFPQCKMSTFQTIDLDQCPIPDCFQATIITDNIINGPVAVTNDADCTTVGVPPTGTPTGPPPAGQQYGCVSGACLLGTTDKTTYIYATKDACTAACSANTSTSFWSKYKWWIIVFLIILVLCIVAAATYFILKDEKARAAKAQRVKAKAKANAIAGLSTGANLNANLNANASANANIAALKASANANARAKAQAAINSTARTAALLNV